MADYELADGRRKKARAGRVEDGLITEDDPRPREHLASRSDESELFWLAGSDKPVIEVAQGIIAPSATKSAKVEQTAHRWVALSRDHRRLADGTATFKRLRV